MMKHSFSYLWTELFGRPGYPPAIAANERHVEACKAINEWCAKPNANYTGMLEHAKLLWERECSINDCLEGKADGIIRYLGGGTGLFALGLISKLDSSMMPVFFAAIIPIGAAIIAIVLASIARGPGFVPGLPTLDQFKREYAEGFEDDQQREIAMLAQWNLAITDLDLANQAKSQRLSQATFAYCLAVALLVLPVGVACWNRPPERTITAAELQKQPDPKEEKSEKKTQPETQPKP